MKSHAGVPVGEFVEEYLTKPTFDEDGVQASSGIGRDGKEYPDPVPMSPPVGITAPDDLMTTIRKMVHHEEFTRLANAEGFDTFDEAGDYEIDGDHEWTDDETPHQAILNPPPPAAEPAPAAPPAPATPETPPAPPAAPSTST